MTHHLITKIAPFFLLLILSCILLYEAWYDSPTYDEPANMAAGFDYVYNHDFRLYPDNPPFVKMLSGLALLPIYTSINFPKDSPYYRQPSSFDPYKLGTEFLYHSGGNPQWIMFLSRIPNILITVSLAILLYLSAKKLYGMNAGLIALLFYTTDPNIRGHGHILAFDIPLAFVSLLFFYIFSLLYYQPKKRLFYACILSLGSIIGFLTKFSFLFVFIIFSIGLAILLFKQKKAISNIFILRLWLAILIATFIGIWMLSIFTGYNKKTFDYEQLPLISSAQQAFRSDLAWNIITKSPVPYFYTAGLRTMFAHNIVSQPTFFLGEVRPRNDWFFYFPVSFLLKVPLPIIILIVYTLYILFIYVIRHNQFQIRQFFPFVAGGMFMLFMMFFSHINNTFRYLLPAYILFIIGTSQIINLINLRKLKIQIFIIVVFSSLLLTSLFSFPYDLSYTNELTGIPPQGYKFLSDSEVDWGQDVARLAIWLKKENLIDTEITSTLLTTADPSYYGIKHKPLTFENLTSVKGIVAISASNLKLGDWMITSSTDYKLGMVKAPLDSLRQKKPDAIIGKSIFVYK